MKKTLLLIVFVLFFASGAFGKDLYVAKDGDDSVSYASNDIAHPWRSIGYGVSAMLPGDTLYIKGGIYKENIKLSSGGSNENYKTIRNYPGETPILDASGGERGIDILHNVHFVRIIGLEIKNATGWGITNRERHSNTNISIQNCNIHDNGDGSGPNEFYQGGICFHSESGNTLINITIDNNEIHHNYRVGLYLYCLECTVSNITISNNLIYRNPAAMRTNAEVYQLWLIGIEYATIHDNYIYFSQKSSRISEKSNSNTFYNNVFGFNGEYGMDINYSCSNNTFKNNIFAYNNVGGANSKSAGSNNNRFWNNVFYENGGLDIFQTQGSGEGSTRTEIQNNIFEGGAAMSALGLGYGIWGRHDYNNYYNVEKAKGGYGSKTIGEWIGPGNDEPNSRNANPWFTNPSSFNFQTSNPALLNCGNSPGDCNRIGLCASFVDNKKVFPYRPLVVHSASYDTPGASRTIDHMVVVSSSSNAWQSNRSSGWIIYEVIGGPRLVKYIGLNGGCRSAYYSPKDFHIALSTLGTSDADFMTVLSAIYVDPSNDDWSMQAQWFELPYAANAKYIKLIIDNSQKDDSGGSNPNIQVTEFYAIGPQEGSESVKIVPQKTISAPTGLKLKEQ